MTRFRGGAMKTQPWRQWRTQADRSPRTRGIPAAFGMAAAMAAALWGCTLADGPDSTVEPGFVPAASVADPLRPENAPQRAPDIMARSAILIDAVTGQSLYEKNPDLRLPVASTQKLLTAMVAIEQGGLEREVTITLRDAMQPPTKLGLAPNSRQRRMDLLAGMLVSSANDAASALASNGNGYYSGFIDRMNSKARELGASNSRFTNPHGLDEAGQLSTARDSAIIAYHAYRDPLIRHFSAQRAIPFRYGDGRNTVLENTNSLVWSWPSYFNGLKGGFTLWGGKCLVASAKHNGSEIIIVLLGSTPDDVFADARKLFKWHETKLQTGYGDAPVRVITE